MLDLDRKNVLSTSTNSYLVFDTYQQHLSGQGSGSRGYVSSPWLKPSDRSQCLSFWVYQASPNVARLGALEVCPKEQPGGHYSFIFVSIQSSFYMNPT